MKTKRAKKWPYVWIALVFFGIGIICGYYVNHKCYKQSKFSQWWRERGIAGGRLLEK